MMSRNMMNLWDRLLNNILALFTRISKMKDEENKGKKSKCQVN